MKEQVTPNPAWDERASVSRSLATGWIWQHGIACLMAVMENFISFATILV